MTGNQTYVHPVIVQETATHQINEKEKNGSINREQAEIFKKIIDEILAKLQ